ncbi:protein FAM81B isoform X1 [Xenopus tropicalis]|uniref:Protein FAM81B isoform X1 n=1 Tax=Xenopus tropicalis TaxID=8364 RepID=A0A8J1IWW9_XENTR|nr:protein FAM81B isoform X1 [Xenopus tropicalis]
MSRENSVQLVPYSDRGQPFLPAIHMNRVDGLEGRLFNQEKTTNILLNQAFKLKDDVSSLRGLHGSHWDTVAQRLLENHMQTMAQIVKQLSKDIETLENQIRDRDQVSTGTSYAVQNLDKRHLYGIGDLRGRVARCDASIAKLSGDLANTKHELQAQEKEIRSINASLETHMKESDFKVCVWLECLPTAMKLYHPKVMQLLGKMEASISEQNNKVKSAQGEQHHEIQLLDFKLGGLLNDIQGQIQNHRRWTESQIQKSSQEQAHSLEQLLGAIQQKMDISEKRLQDNIQHLTIKVDKTVETQRLETKLNKLKHAEDKINARMNAIETEIWDELENMKSEYRAGFQSIQESLNSLQQIQETKVNLETKKVHRDIKQLRRKIVELKDI